MEFIGFDLRFDQLKLSIGMKDLELRSLSFSQEDFCALSLAAAQELCWRKEEVIAREFLVLLVAMCSAGD